MTVCFPVRNARPAGCWPKRRVWSVRIGYDPCWGARTGQRMACVIGSARPACAAYCGYGRVIPVQRGRRGSDKGRCHRVSWLNMTRPATNGNPVSGGEHQCSASPERIWDMVALKWSHFSRQVCSIVSPVFILRPAPVSGIPHSCSATRTSHSGKKYAAFCKVFCDELLPFVSRSQVEARWHGLSGLEL